MEIIYTSTGIPAYVEDGAKTIGSPLIKTLLEDYCRQESVTTKNDLDIIKHVVKFWDGTGGLFGAAVKGNVPITSSAFSFLKETADVLTGGRDKRKCDHSYWKQILVRGTEGVTVSRIPSENSASLHKVAGMSTTDLIFTWIQRLGLGDLLMTLDMWINTRD